MEKDFFWGKKGIYISEKQNHSYLLFLKVKF